MNQRSGNFNRRTSYDVTGSFRRAVLLALKSTLTVQVLSEVYLVNTPAKGKVFIARMIAQVPYQDA
jgi:hypothetical protein